MKYDFPIIEHIDQFEPIIAKNPSAYYKTDKGSYVVFNYSNLNPDNFPPVQTPEDAYIREARGIAFLKSTGELISRPFHKFFNLGERPETEIDILAFRDARLYDKLDGSMIHVLNLPHGPRLATRGGITDVSLAAEAFVAANPLYQAFIHQFNREGFTPIFEYVGPTNKIVLNYDQPGLILLDVRNRRTGQYLGTEGLRWTGIPTVSEVSATTQLEEIRAWEGREGVVVTLSDGHRVKIKADAYVRLHRYIDVLKSDRHFVMAYTSEEWDDIYSNAVPEIKDRLNEARMRLQEFISSTSLEIVYDIYDNFGLVLTRETRRFFAEFVLGEPKRARQSGVYFKIADRIQDRDDFELADLSTVAKFWVLQNIKAKTRSQSDWETNNLISFIKLIPETI